jgi:hypothetical protein
MSTVTVRTPHNHELPVHISSTKVSIESFRLAARVNGVHMSTQAMMVYNPEKKVPIADEDLKHSLAHMGVLDGDHLDVIQHMGVDNKADLMFKQFFARSEPEELENGNASFPTDVEFTLHFVHNSVENYIYLPDLLQPHPIHHIEEGLENVFGEEKAITMGFKKWSADIQSHKVFVLELRKEGVVHNGSYEFSHLEKVRFNYEGINNLWVGVDVHSWQRYTSEVPIDCYLELGGDSFLLPDQIKIVPREPLKPNTWYAVLVQNGCKIAPKKLGSSDICNFVHDFVCEDLLLPFKTKT